uniref:Helicase C-terminal domain-containing protein n=1 Tax=Cannabis sativa TaxID=3483 RepID=A0A803Q333_CANSA
MTLVATNVAARGLDIKDVQLIIQCEPPRHLNFVAILFIYFIGCSLITCRIVLFSGNSGVVVMLYDPRRSNFSKVEREFSVKFEHISPPRPDVAKAAVLKSAEIINQISDR